jgi:hypothetical protein
VRTLRGSATAALVAIAAAACNGSTPTNVAMGPTFQLNPCSPNATVQLDTMQSTTVDCSNGGTTVTLAGNGASYVIVPQFATDQGADQLVAYTISTGTVIGGAPSADRTAVHGAPAWLPGGELGADVGLLPRVRPGARQVAFQNALLARGRERALAGAFTPVIRRAPLPSGGMAPVLPTVGSIRDFHVRSTFDTANATWDSVAAKLVYAGTTLLLYVDTLAPSDGFTPQQLQNFGQYFDDVLLPLDTAAFGGPSDIDQNGRVIMLMSPVVNADTPASVCAVQGYVAGFIDPVDFDGPSDPNSNQGEIFYSIVPDSNGTVSCAHSVTNVGFDLPAVFLHEMQHLINFSHHVLLGGGVPNSDWMDEGLSIIAEELGSLYYEDEGPAPACRTSPAQLFPDSAEGFIFDPLYDSYEYALLPDTASLTLHDDSENGFAWRGGDWLLMRWLGDHYGAGIFRQLENGPADGVTDIESVTGAAFPQLLADFGLALYTDSLPGVPRSSVPVGDRFTSRNLHQLWARLYTTSAGPDVPTPTPLFLYPISGDTTAEAMDPGTMAYYRLDTPADSATITIRFAQPAGTAFAPSLAPQLAVFRLPPGQ